MKRINAVFTAINILVVVVMLVLVGYEYRTVYLNTPPSAAFLAGCVFIPPLALINGIWLLIRILRGEAPCSVLDGADSAGHRQLFSVRLNAVFILLNVLLAAVITIHCIIYTLRTGGSVVLDFIGIMFYYSVPVVLINDAWVVIRMNKKL